MRILFVIHQFYPEFKGGTESVTLKLARAAQRAGHYVHVLACHIGNYGKAFQDGEEQPEFSRMVYSGVPVSLLSRTLLSSTVEFSFETDQPVVERIAAFIKLEKFDIAHIMHPMRMASAMLAVQRCELPYMVTLTDFLFACFRINMTGPDNLLCEGPDSGARCAEKCFCPSWTEEGLKGRYRQALGLLAGAGARICPSQYVAGRFQKAFPELDFAVITHGIDMTFLSAPANSGHIKYE